MRKLLTALALGASLAPSAASAQLFLGARVGYALAGGDFSKDSPMKDAQSAMIPIQVDFGLALRRALAIGVYGGIGPARIADDFQAFCDATSTDCSGLNVRLGAQATLHAPLGGSKLWGGVLLGWEEQRYKLTGAGGTGEVRWRGYEAGLQGGLDFGSDGFRFGPYAGLSFGQYQSLSTSGGAPPVDIADKALHTWLTFGLRGAFGL